MQKYRVLKSYPKHITNSGRLITLKPGRKVYLKKEAQVARLVRMGFIKPIVELPKKSKKKASRKVRSDKSDKTSESKAGHKSQPSSKRKSKSEYLNKKKNSGKSGDESN